MSADRRLHLALRVGLVLGAGCWSGPGTPALSNRTDTAAAPAWVMTPRGIGPLDGTTVATEPALRERLPGLRIVAQDLGETSGIVFDVYDGSERVFYIVPDDVAGYIEGDERQYEQTVFAVFAVSPRVAVEGKTWRVGQPFADDAGLDRCECWGGGDVAACFRIGTRLRVIFDEPCADALRDGARAMRGKPIARVMWKRVLEPDGLFDDNPD